MTVWDVVSLVLMLFGTFFMFVGSVGIIRLPDFFARTHATGKTDTVGIVLVLLGLAVYEGLSTSSIKLIIATMFIVLVNPVGVHALAKAALESGLKPWFVKLNKDKDPREEADPS
jgi:multicomponent Na+:H+ antiporter subunit G